ncbi:MAG: inverse autotransporter beta domain-containing protein [Gammaproteobacteria bacterium]|nr:inverse autotransporter beta domain-containing protein [Gammaproteobacteria bacterium]
MKTKLIFVLLSAFFVVNQNVLAKGALSQTGANDNQSFENNIGFKDGISPFNSEASYLPYLQFGGTKFFNVDSAKAASGADLFVPIWQQPTQLFFTHLRVYDRTGKPFEGNAHLGYRHLVPEKEHLYGIYGAFDRKRTDFGNYFNQLTFGVEGWFRNLFVGGNYYQPIGSSSRFVSITDESAEFDRIQNNIWLTTNKQYERAMSGGDAEVGYEFVKGIVGYVGGYYFGAKGVDTVCGPKARVTYDWSLEDGKRIAGIFDKLGLEIGAQKDKPRGTTYYVSANIRIGLLPNRNGNLQGVARHMVDLVRRDVDIMSGTATEQSKDVIRDEDGRPIKIVEIVGDDDGDSKGVIKSDDLHNAVSDPNVHIVSVKGHIDDVGHAVHSVKGEKVLVFSDHVPIVSPHSGKTMMVNIGSPGRVGSISTKSMKTLMAPKSAQLLRGSANEGSGTLYTYQARILDPVSKLNNDKPMSSKENKEAPAPVPAATPVDKIIYEADVDAGPDNVKDNNANVETEKTGGVSDKMWGSLNKTSMPWAKFARYLVGSKVKGAKDIDPQARAAASKAAAHETAAPEAAQSESDSSSQSAANKEHKGIADRGWEAVNRTSMPFAKYARSWVGSGAKNVKDTDPQVKSNAMGSKEDASEAPAPKSNDLPNANKDSKGFGDKAWESVDKTSLPFAKLARYIVGSKPKGVNSDNLSVNDPAVDSEGAAEKDGNQSNKNAENKDSKGVIDKAWESANKTSLPFAKLARYIVGSNSKNVKSNDLPAQDAASVNSEQSEGSDSRAEKAWESANKTSLPFAKLARYFVGSKSKNVKSNDLPVQDAASANSDQGEGSGSRAEKAWESANKTSLPFAKLARYLVGSKAKSNESNVQNDAGDSSSQYAAKAPQGMFAKGWKAFNKVSLPFAKLARNMVSVVGSN